MWVLSQQSDIACDFTSAEIIRAMGRDEQGNDYIAGFQIVLHSFGAAFPVAQYQELEQAQKVFIDMMAKLKDGDSFYDVRARERKLLA